MKNHITIVKPKTNPCSLNECKRSGIAQHYRKICFTLLIACFFTVNANAALVNAQIPLQSQFKNVDTELRAKIAQKLFIDLRYYCSPKAQGYCLEPLLELPDEIGSMLAKSKVGGVILFSENLSSPEQIIRLTHDLQVALMPAHKKVPGLAQQGVKQREPQTFKQPLYIPLYIGIDQEGGRVSRLPQSYFMGFAGNMAIGATAKAHKNKYSIATSLAMAKHLNLLGINVNFAPVIDVNNNPNNPIINVRAYGQFPNLVSDLGGASILTMQEQNISVAAKHFPGHGDTFMDSHVGLPRVNHSREMINSIDLLPFRKVIGNPNTRPDMIMTAHIQYPALDSTRFVGDKAATENADNAQATAELPVLPATLSRKILTGILRQELAYSGLIITDALNMKSITQYLTPIEAVIQSFSAGADITLMPYHISSPQDAIGFLDWLNELTIFIAQDNELKALVDASYRRILTHKAKRNIAKRSLLPLADKLALLEDTSYKTSDYNLALSLSQASFTQIKGLTTPLVAQQRLLVFMPDKLRCQAFKQYWQEQVDTSDVNCLSILSEAIPLNSELLANIDAVIVGDAFPALGFHESVDYEGIQASGRIDNELQLCAINALVAQAKFQDIPRILVKLRSPYISVNEAQSYSAIFASYDYQVAQVSSTPNNNEYLFSPAFSSLVKVITGKQTPLGTLPVTLSAEAIKALPAPKTKSEPAPQEE